MLEKFSLRECILIFGFKYIIQKSRKDLQIAEKQFKLRKEGTNKS